MYHGERLIEIVLYIVSGDSQDNEIQQVGMYILKSLTYKTKGDLKRHLTLGELGIIEKMLIMIKERLKSSKLLKHLTYLLV